MAWTVTVLNCLPACQTVQRLWSGMTENRPEKNWIVAAIMQSYDYWRQFKIGTRISTNFAPASGGNWSPLFVEIEFFEATFLCDDCDAHAPRKKYIKKKKERSPLLAVTVHILREPFRLMIFLDDILCVRCCYVRWLRANRHKWSHFKGTYTHIPLLQENVVSFLSPSRVSSASCLCSYFIPEYLRRRFLPFQWSTKWQKQVRVDSVNDLMRNKYSDFV